MTTTTEYKVFSTDGEPLTRGFSTRAEAVYEMRELISADKSQGYAHTGRLYEVKREVF